MNKLLLIYLIVYYLYLFIKLPKTLQCLQQNRYNRGHKYIKWINSHLKENFLNIELLYIPIIILAYFLNFNICFISIILYAIFILVKEKILSDEQKKLPLAYTKRIFRLYVTIIILYLLPLIFILNNSSLVIYLVSFILIYFNNFIVILANYINVPVERLVGLYFKNKAQNKLKNMNGLKVIGITGSYGKTSSKNILNDILNIKYNSFATPKNFNTPFGLMITINDYLDKFNDYFIAEMGACKTGEIKELCNLVHPTYGILTKIGVAHLETFGSEENIQKTKFELIESLPDDGIGILNGDDPKQVDYNGNIKCKTLFIGIDNKDVDLYAYDVKLSSNGTSFKVKFKNEEKSYEFNTKLLGKANIYNILAGILLGKNLNISIDQLQTAVKTIRPVEHRLEMKKYLNMYMIDDAYNANPDGSKMALDVLSMMDGKKIAISSGIIELGSIANDVHYDLGKYMSKRTDEVILIGKEQTKYIYKGLIDSNFKENKIHVLNNIMDAFSLLPKLKENDTYILLQSDLPDIFNEK